MAEYGGYAPRQPTHFQQTAQPFRPQQPKAYGGATMGPPPVVDAPSRPMDTPTCNCGQPAVQRVAGPSAKNPGKEFYACAVGKNNGGCDFFVWTDGTSPKRQRVAPADSNLLPFLTERLNSVEAKLDTLLGMMSGNLNGPQSMAENFQQHQ